jgi:sugar (pentulose or hexulose) kinase
MVATNAVKPGTGNISAGTSAFAMLVLDKALSKLHPQIDMITTPTGKPVAMVHSNTCTSDLDAWVNLFGSACAALQPQAVQAQAMQGAHPDKTELYGKLYNAALSGDPDCGGLVSLNYLAGEHMTGFHEGRPLFVRTPDSRFTLGNFMRSLLYSSMATLKIGMNILTENEGVKLSKLLGHGGLFKTPGVAQKLMAGALDIPVAVMESAGEGGAWGIALLAAYTASRQGSSDAAPNGNSGTAPNEETLESFLGDKVFADSAVSVIEPDPADVQGFKDYMARYMAVLAVERAAVEAL